jgi:hypothetical protein
VEVRYETNQRFGFDSGFAVQSSTSDALLSKVAGPNRTVLMFELPLLPNKIAYGQIQRRLSAKYRVALIPKRYFAQVIGDADATTDGLYLSASGARRMAALVTQVLSPFLKSCQSRLRN